MACSLVKSNKYRIIFSAINIFAVLFFVLFPLEKIEYHTYPQQLQDVKLVDRNVIDVMLSTDSTQKPGIYALINSILFNTNAKSTIYLRLLCEHQWESVMIEKELNLLFDEELKSSKFLFEIKSFDQYPKFLQLIKNNWREVGRRYQQHSHNVMTYGRLFMAHIFPQLKKVIFLDPDVIFQTDISQLFEYDTTKVIMWAVFPDDGTHKMRYMFNDDMDALKHVGLYESWMHDREGFNAGIHLVNLTAWRQHNLTRKSRDIIIYNNKLKNNLLHFDDQCILNIIFTQLGEKIGQLDKKWNVLHLGWKRIDYSTNISQPRRVHLTNAMINNGYALHWCGKKKPWYKSFHFNQRPFQKYVPKKFDNQTISKWNNDWLSYNESKNI